MTREIALLFLGGLIGVVAFNGLICLASFIKSFFE